MKDIDNLKIFFNNLTFFDIYKNENWLKILYIIFIKRILIYSI